MKSEYEIIDNVLDPKLFDDLQAWFTSNNFSWYHQSNVAYDEEEDLSEVKNKEWLNLRKVPLTKIQKDYNFALGHLIYYRKIWCVPETWDKIVPLLQAAKVKQLIRSKVNYYPKTPEIVHHKDHVDFVYKHKGALFYINDNDGLTVLEDGTEVESVANRLILFDTSRPHHSTTTTNADRRLNINFNYF